MWEVIKHDSESIAQFCKYMRNLNEYSQRKSDEWGHISLETKNELWNLFDAFLDAFEASIERDVPQPIQEERAKQLEKAFNDFTDLYMRFALVVNEMIDFVVKPRDTYDLQIDFWIHGSTHNLKPKDYDGAVIIWEILDKPTVDRYELSNSALAVRTPTVFHFEEKDFGKTVYFALAWQNDRGIKGQWSEIKSATIQYKE